MANLTLFRVESVQIERADFPDMNVTYITVQGKDGRVCISLHSDKPLEVKEVLRACDHSANRRYTTPDIFGGPDILRCADCGGAVDA